MSDKFATVLKINTTDVTNKVNKSTVRIVENVEGISHFPKAVINSIDSLMSITANIKDDKAVINVETESATSTITVKGIRLAKQLLNEITYVAKTARGRKAGEASQPVDLASLLG